MARDRRETRYEFELRQQLYNERLRRQEAGSRDRNLDTPAPFVRKRKQGDVRSEEETVRGRVDGR